MKKTNSAFTLIELLVVITIIAILASIALPVFNGVTERANQTKDLSNAKQVGVARKLFASDNNGFFPRSYRAQITTARRHVADECERSVLVALPNYLQSEDVFTVAASKRTPKNPDNKIDAGDAGIERDTLKAGENTYAYVAGLTDTSNPAFPLPGGWIQSKPRSRSYEASTSRSRAEFGRQRKRSSFLPMRAGRS